MKGDGHVARPAVIGKRRQKSIRAGTWRPALGALLCCAALSAHAADDATAALAKERKCMNCHAIDQKLVGPAFKAVAARYANDKDAEERLAKKIRAGGSGAWGVVPMPANDVTDPEAARLAHWVLQQK